MNYFRAGLLDVTMMSQKEKQEMLIRTIEDLTSIISKLYTKLASIVEEDMIL